MNVVVAYLPLHAIYLPQGHISAVAAKMLGIIVWEGGRDICSPKVRNTKNTQIKLKT